MSDGTGLASHAGVVAADADHKTIIVLFALTTETLASPTPTLGALI